MQWGLVWTVCLFLVPTERACSQVVLNEVLPAPTTDWTDNGIFASAEDEWIEIVNVGATIVSVDDLLVSDAAGGPSTPRAGLSGTLAPGEHLFLTGEQAADWESLNGFPQLGLSLNNSGDTVYLFQVSGAETTVVDSLTYGSEAGANVSLGRDPDGTGTWAVCDALLEGGSGWQPTPGGANGGIAKPKILESSVTPAFPTDQDPIVVRANAADSDGIVECTLFVRIDGGAVVPQAMALVDGLATWGDWEATIPAQPAGTLLTVSVRVSDGSLIAQTNDVDVVVGGSDNAVALNEILADPPPDLAGDANGDGVRDTSDDEFVEVINHSSASVDLTGWSLHDATALRHAFGDGLVLAPGEIYVVFGGGSPAGIPSRFDVASTGGLSLNNTADDVRLVGPDGVPLDVHAYGSEGNGDESMIRVPDGTGPWTLPSVAGAPAPFSPGEPNGTATSLTEASWARIKGLYQR